MLRAVVSAFALLSLVSSFAAAGQPQSVVYVREPAPQMPIRDPAPPAPAGTPWQMNRVAVLPTLYGVVSSPAGFDLDHDGRLEFVAKTGSQTWSFSYDIYECVSDDAFTLVHTLTTDCPSQCSYYPSDGGDADGDGRGELTVFGRTMNDFYLLLYESPAPTAYPMSVAWEMPDEWWAVGAKIADTDGDGAREVVLAGQGEQHRVAVHESVGDDAFVETYYAVAPDMHTSQSMDVADDLDGDGRPEILFGGLATPDDARVYAFESTGNDAYRPIWSGSLVYTDGQIVNVSDVVAAGDLDGDGRGELVAGGLKTVPDFSHPFFAVFFVFEATADDVFESVATLVVPMASFLHDTALEVADVDGDGRGEILLGTGPTLKIYRSVADNTWQEAWSGAPAGLSFIGAGDHDRDGKSEVIFSEAASTGIWEIEPADAADADGDHHADAADNCPFESNPDQLDADGDAVGNACDNCVYAANPGQGTAVFGQTLRALNPAKFFWASPAETILVRGTLSGVSNYAFDLVLTLALATSFEDSASPPQNVGWYYLVRPDCPVGSWQSSPGAEPGRDAALP